jgi:hypothetical protein
MRKIVFTKNKQQLWNSWSIPPSASEELEIAALVADCVACTLIAISSCSTLAAVNMYNLGKIDELSRALRQT